MAAGLNDAYKAIADVNLWLKTRTGDDLYLSDIPSIIPLRWQYFIDNWQFIKQDLIQSAATYSNPDFFNQQIFQFDSLVESQRYSSINPLNNSNVYYQYYTIFDNISIQSINLTNQETTLMQDAVTTVQLFSKNDFVSRKTTITNYRDRITDTYGLGDPTYNSTYNYQPIPAQVSATIVNENYLLQLQSSIKTINFILANLFAVDSAVDPFALARANANNSNVSIGSYQSGYLDKLRYQEDLEGVAARTLGDPNKWLDIAIANGLQPPYIDEIGQLIPLIANGSKNQINIAGTDAGGNSNINKVYINQAIFISSSTETSPNQLSITNIRQIPVSGEIVLDLDSATNLSIYRLTDNASIRVYAPNTINSSFFILIPSTTPLSDQRVDEVPWFLATAAADEKRAKIDIALDDNNEINFTTNSDISLSYGLQNAIQAIKLKIITELGSLRYHPTFGMISVVGKTNTNIAGIRDLITQSLNTQIGADSRFDRIETLSVDYSVNNSGSLAAVAISISMTVRLAGGTRVIPITFTVNNL